MSDQLLSTKSLFRDTGVNLFSGVILGACTFIFSSSFWLGVITGGVIIVAIFFLWLWKKYKRLIKLIFSGCAGYYYSFGIEENPVVWVDAKKSFCYLGISCDSIMEPLRRWIEKNPLSIYKILLMKPHSMALKRQEAFQKGHNIDFKYDELTAEAQKDIDMAGDATSKRIEGAISVLKTTKPYLLGHMQIKLYEEFSPWWMYLMDDRITYVGILEKGKRGSESPVLVMRKNDQFASPFDAFMNHWERLWQSAGQVDA